MRNQLATVVQSGYAAAALVFSGAANSQQFVDWISATEGTVAGIGITLTGETTHATFGPLNAFSWEFFTPSIDSTDYIKILGSSTPRTYTVTFSQPVLDPVLHLGSLASTLNLSSSAMRLSGQQNFRVLGTTVRGDLSDLAFPEYSNGTVRLPGQFSTFTFTTTANYSFTNEIALHIGVASVIPEPPIWACLSLGSLFLLGAVRKNHRDSAATEDAAIDA